MVKPDLFNQPSMQAAVQERDIAMRRVQVSAGAEFSRRARAFILESLRHGPRSGEDLTDLCKAAGIVPANGDRAFGPVYSKLLRDQLIVKAGACPRRKGHASEGGKIYQLKEEKA